MLGAGSTERGGGSGSQCQPEQVETGLAAHWGTDGCRRRGLELESRCAVGVGNARHTLTYMRCGRDSWIDESGVEGRG